MSRNVPAMDRPAVRRLWRLMPVILGLGLVLVSASLARRSADPTPPPVPSSLFVLVQVRNKHVSEDQVRLTFQAAARKLGSKEARVEIRELNPELYRELQNLTNRLESTHEAVEAGKPYVRQKATTGKVEYELNLNKPGMVLQELELISEKDGKKETRKFKPTNAGDKSAVVVPTALPQVYTVRLEPGEAVASFVARGVVLQKPGERQPVEIRGSWPQPENHYLVAMRNFTGNHQDLLKIIQTDQVPNPLEDAILGQDLTFVFASYGFKLPRTGTFDGNDYIPFLTTLARRKPARVWMLFPLTDEECTEAGKTYGSLKPDALPRAIRQAHPAWARANPQLAVAPQQPPRWIELPFDSNRGGFTRRLELKDVRQLQAKYPTARRLIVYEFDDGETQEAIAQEDERTRKLVYALEQDVKEWPGGIAEVVRKQK